MKLSEVRRLVTAIAVAIATLVPVASSLAASAAQPGYAKESREIITKDNAALILIDHQPQTIFGIGSHDRQTIINNTEALAKTAKAFGLPVVLTTVAADTFTGPLIPEVRRVLRTPPAALPSSRINSASNAWCRRARDRSPGSASSPSCNTTGRARIPTMRSTAS